MREARKGGEREREGKIDPASTLKGLRRDIIAKCVQSASTYGA